MSKFKVGDKVRWGNSGLCTVSDIKKTIRGDMYELKLPDGGTFYPVDEQSLADAVRKYGTNSCASSNPVVQNALKAKNGKFGFDPAAAVALKSVKDARIAMQIARSHIGQAEDDDEAPGQARDMDKIIKEIDNLIGWLKDYA